MVDWNLIRIGSIFNVFSITTFGGSVECFKIVPDPKIQFVEEKVWNISMDYSKLRRLLYTISLLLLFSVVVVVVVIT